MEFRRGFETEDGAVTEGRIEAGGARSGPPEGEAEGGEGEGKRLTAEVRADWIEPEPEAMGIRGLADERWRRPAVEVLEEGEAAREARDSTSSRLRDCQP